MNLLSSFRYPWPMSAMLPGQPRTLTDLSCRAGCVARKLLKNRDESGKKYLFHHASTTSAHPAT